MELNHLEYNLSMYLMEHLASTVFKGHYNPKPVLVEEAQIYTYIENIECIWYY